MKGEDILTLILEIEKTCCSRKTVTLYQFKDNSKKSETEILDILAPKYLGLEKEIPPSEKSAFNANAIRVQQARWKCYIIDNYKISVAAAVDLVTDADIERLSDLLDSIAVNTRSHLAHIARLDFVDKTAGRTYVATLNLLFTGAINIAANTAFGPVGPCVAAFALSLGEHIATYCLAGLKTRSIVIDRHLPVARFNQLLTDCNNKPQQFFRTLETFNEQLSLSYRSSIWSNFIIPGLALACGESIARVLPGSKLLKNALGFFVPLSSATATTTPEQLFPRPLVTYR